MAAHSYWRIRSTCNNGDGTFTAITEIEMHTSIGGADQCTGGTAFASGQVSGSEDAAKAFDNSTATQWAQSTPRLCYVGYQFASPVDIVEYVIVGRASFTGQSPNSFTLEFSDDGITWGFADARTGITWTSLESKTFTVGTTAEIWRFEISANNGNAFTVLCEAELRATVGGADQCTGGQVSASNCTNSGENPSKAFDDSTATVWAEQSSTNVYVQYHFASAITVVEYVIKGRTGSTDQNPKAWRLRKSTDLGLTWTDIDERWNQTGWTDAQVRTFSTGNTSTSTAQLSQAVAEVLRINDAPNLQLSQVVAEVLRPNAAVLTSTRRPTIFIIT